MNILLKFSLFYLDRAAIVHYSLLKLLYLAKYFEMFHHIRHR